MKLKKKSIKNKYQKSPESTEQTVDSGYEIRITL